MKGAYLVNITFICDHIDCDKDATHELRTQQNEVFGRFCQSCGERRLAKLLEEDSP